MPEMADSIVHLMKSREAQRRELQQSDQNLAEEIVGGIWVGH